LRLHVFTHHVRGLRRTVLKPFVINQVEVDSLSRIQKDVFVGKMPAQQVFRSDIGYASRSSSK
jgi:hypothetical protein